MALASGIIQEVLASAGVGTVMEVGEGSGGDHLGVPGHC